MDLDPKCFFLLKHGVTNQDKDAISIVSVCEAQQNFKTEFKLVTKHHKDSSVNIYDS